MAGGDHQAHRTAGGLGVAVDEELRRRLRRIALRGIARAGKQLAGADTEAVCSTLRQWAERGQRELPWLAGPGLTALHAVGVELPRGPDVLTVERFLLGVASDSHKVTQALDACETAAGDVPAPLPPDARGALEHSAQNFFTVLANAYEELHPAVRTAHRRDADELGALWQRRLDSAADELQFRALRLSAPAAPTARRQRRTKGRRRRSDHPGFALAFVVAALLTAGYVMWLVLQGWPAVPVATPF